MIDLSTLNPPQKEAVMSTEGPLLILAGAGSGKTKVLTYRIAYILDAGLAGPDNILAMTFTNKAAGEMKDRIGKLLAPFDSAQDKLRPELSAYSLTWMGTFHSICVKILKKYAHLVGLSNNFVIYDSSDQLVATKEAMKNINVSNKEFNPNAIHSYISSAKNELVDAETYATYAQGYFQQIVATVYPEYQRILRENNAVDFDDLLLYVVKLFVEHKDVLARFQEQFKYILVDEYQDTNHAQYTIVTKLAEKYRNLCSVGDDDQSIYAFRGATIKNILNFEKDYPETKVIKLEQNYRSTKKILDASYHVISKNKSRKDKKLWTENEEGNNIIVYTARDEEDEANWIVNKILEEGKVKSEDPSTPLRAGSNSVDYNEFAVLYRTNAQSRSLEESFIQAGIPYKIIGGVRFYERKEIKDILAYLRVIYNTKDNKSLERIINVPKRAIGPTTVERLLDEARSEGLSLIQYLLDKPEAREQKTELKKFVGLMEDFIKKSREINIVELIDYILDKSGYVQMLQDGTSENESRIENLKELITVASKYKDYPPGESIEAFLDEVGLLEGFVEREDIKNFVTLMTIHSAKGLEFEYVFVVGMEENLFPHSNSMLDQKEMEEERRLAYVAITRAKRNLHLTHAAKRRYFGITQANPASRFINDIDESLIDRVSEINKFSSSQSEWSDDSFDDDKNWKIEVNFKVGDKVKHEYFGIGKIKYMDDSIVEVDFGSVYGVKELMLEYARLEKL